MARISANYNFAPADQVPSIFYGDVATSDAYYSGSLLGMSFSPPFF